MLRSHSVILFNRVTIQAIVTLYSVWVTIDSTVTNGLSFMVNLKEVDECKLIV